MVETNYIGVPKFVFVSPPSWLVATFQMLRTTGLGTISTAHAESSISKRIIPILNKTELVINQKHSVFILVAKLSAT